MGRSSVNLNDHDEDEVGGQRPLQDGVENNQSANERCNNAATAAGLTSGQRQLLHQSITGQNLTYDEIYEEALAIKRDYPNK
jgi:hypothetical protein